MVLIMKMAVIFSNAHGTNKSLGKASIFRC